MSINNLTTASGTGPSCTEEQTPAPTEAELSCGVISSLSMGEEEHIDAQEESQQLRRYSENSTTLTLKEKTVFKYNSDHISHVAQEIGVNECDVKQIMTRDDIMLGCILIVVAIIIISIVTALTIKLAEFYLPQ